MLEQQQAQIVAGMRELYRRLRTGEGWPGAWLEEFQISDNTGSINVSKSNTSHPLTHDILERLNLLHIRSGEEAGSPINDNVGRAFSQQRFDDFDENCTRLQQRLIREGAPMAERRRSSEPQQKKQQRGHDTWADQHRRKRLRTDSTCLEDGSDVEDKTESGNNEEEQDGNGDDVDENESEDEPNFMSAEPLTPDSTLASASPETLALQVPNLEQQHSQPAVQNCLLKFSDPFSGNDVPSISPLVPAIQLTRSSSSSNGDNDNDGNHSNTSINYKRHQSLPFINQPHPLYHASASMTNHNNNFAMASKAIKAHSPFHVGMNPAEVLRVSWAASSAATAAKSSLPPSSNMSQVLDSSNQGSTPFDFLNRNTSSVTAATRLSTTTAANAAAGEQPAAGLGDLSSATHHNSFTGLKNVLSPTASLSTAQQSIPSPLTPLTPQVSISTAKLPDTMNPESKTTVTSGMLPASATSTAVTLTPSLTPELDIADWQADESRGFDGLAGFGGMNGLNGLGGLIGLNGFSDLDGAGAAWDVDMDFSRFIRT